MPTQTGSARMSVSVEDISRSYYESAGYSRWITQLHVDPLELIVSDDADGKLYRVPVEMGKGGKFTFGEEREVAIEYKDVKTPAGSKAAASMPFRWQTKAAALSAAGIAETTVVPTQPDGQPETMLRQIDFDTTDEPAVPPAPKVERQLPPAEAIKKVAAATATKTPDAETATGQPDKTKEASGMAIDAAKIREALGLSADAPLTDEAKAELLAALGLTDPKPAVTGDEVQTLLSAIPANAGVRVLDEVSYKQLLARGDKGELAYQRVELMERDTFLGKAMDEGRFPPSRLAVYQEMYDKNPKATKEFIGLMPKNSVPTSLSGSYGAAEVLSEADDAYAGVYGRGE